MANEGDNRNKALVQALNATLADHLALYVKTKNFHWHVAGPRFRDLHLLFDEQAAEMLGVTDDIAERVRKNGANTLTSIASIAQNTQISDQDDAGLKAEAMVEELKADNQTLRSGLVAVKQAAEEADDFATAGVVDDWIDQSEQRIWFLTQIMS